MQRKVLFLERVNFVVNQYLVDAKSHNVTFWGRTFNMRHKSAGIARATKYLANIEQRYHGEENEKVLVAKVYVDIISDSTDSTLGSSTDLRQRLRHALFHHLGVTNKMIEEISRDARQLDNARGAIAASYGSGAIMSIAVEQALGEELRLAMMRNGFDLSMLGRQDVEMLVTSYPR